MNTPYLWSFSTHYDRGKYVADGRWSETTPSDQCGAAVIIKALVDGGHIERPAQLAWMTADGDDFAILDCSGWHWEASVRVLLTAGCTFGIVRAARRRRGNGAAAR